MRVIDENKVTRFSSEKQCTLKIMQFFNHYQGSLNQVPGHKNNNLYTKNERGISNAILGQRLAPDSLLQSRTERSSVVIYSAYDCITNFTQFFLSCAMFIAEVHRLT